MSQLEPAAKRPAKNIQTNCNKLRALSLDLADLTRTLEAAGIIPFPLVEVDDSENCPLRKALQGLMDAAAEFLDKCEKEPNASWIDEDNGDEDDCHPDESWKKAMLHAGVLETKRRGFSFLQECFTNPSIAKTGYLFEKIRAALKAREEKKEPPENPNPFKFLAAPPLQSRPLLKSKKVKLNYQDIAQFAADIESCGIVVALAWLNKDASFFSELAKKVTIAIGHRRTEVADGRRIKDITKEERLITVAIDLWYKTKQNPSRDLVLKTLADEGVHIRAKDQSGYFKRCKLSFLTSQRKPGRPRKHAIDSASQAEVRTPPKKAKLVRSQRLNKNDDGFSRPPVWESPTQSA